MGLQNFGAWLLSLKSEEISMMMMMVVVVVMVVSENFLT